MHAPFHRLRTNGATAPLGVASDTVRLSWVAGRTLDRGDEIVVEVTGFRPRTMDHDARSLIVPLPRTRHVEWRVGVRRDAHVEWSERSRFTTAPDLLGTGAAWVTHPDLAAARAEGDHRTVWFAITVDARRSDTGALLHLAAPGVVDVRVDGRPPGTGLLGPGYAELTSETPAATYDLGALTAGPHTVTVELASGPFWISHTEDRYAKFTGRHRSPQLIAMIEQFGTGLGDVRTTVTRPGETACGRGATTAAHWYGGEDFDAGLPEPWQATDAVVAVSPAHPCGELWWPEHPPMAIVDTLRALRADETALDFGINIAGVPRVRWHAADADRLVEMYPAELLAQGGVDQSTTGAPIVDRLRIPAGSSGTWSPRFGYHGFRYLELRGATGRLHVDALVIRAANERSGSFSSGSPFLQRLHDVIDRAVQGNMHSVFTDCPHREKLGWLEQLHFCFGAIARSYDVEAHLRDMLHHARRAQLPSGAIPNTVPDFVDFSGHAYLGDPDAFRFDVNWGGVIVHLPLAHFREYGDRRVLDDNIPAMKAYLDHLESRQVDGLIDFGLGDWIAIDTSTPRVLVASHGHLRALEAAARVARLVEDDEWETVLRDRAERVHRALRRFEDEASALGQTGLVILADIAERRGDRAFADLTVERLRARIAEDGGAFTAGEVTFAALIDQLHRRGHGDFILQTISRTDVAGYGMQLDRGVTSLAETWSGERLEVGEGSNNHFMLGMIEDWLHHDVAGLRQADLSTAWRAAVVEPTFLAEVPSAASVSHTVHGTYAVEWRRDGETITVEVVVPPDGRATVRIPGIAEHEVLAGVHGYSLASRATESLVVARD